MLILLLKNSLPTRSDKAQLNGPSPSSSALKRGNSKTIPSRRSKIFAASCGNPLIHQWPSLNLLGFFASSSEIRARRSWMTMEQFDFRRRKKEGEASFQIPKYPSLMPQTVLFPFLPWNPASSLIHHVLPFFVLFTNFAFTSLSRTFQFLFVYWTYIVCSSFTRLISFLLLNSIFFLLR